MKTNIELAKRPCAVLFLLLCAVPALVLADDEDKKDRGRLEDRQDILALIYAYGYNVDTKNPTATAALFTDDAVWAWYAGPQRVLFMHHRGKGEITQLFVAGAQGHIAQGIQSRHYQTNTVFSELDGKRARAKTMILVTWQYATETAPRPIRSGYYEDEFVKTRDGWKFKERVFFADQP
jgi:hypothetical protein